ncbi:hypothetical protein [uncultured Paraglaciecola sp.]|uniref:hypothetical protein n=1 Tax=uncultured Paraglaciecola sp. TaxID=1765024 RepID=UPI002598BD8E|nr:hypothetical protein [uncultured Paraglaciecola sp.]
MSEKNKIETEVFFRLLKLDKFQGVTLSREINGASYAPIPNTNHFIGEVLITESLDNLDDLNVFFVRQQITLEQCDILVKVDLSIDNHSVQIPNFVNKLLKHIDCTITIETCNEIPTQEYT